MVVRHRVSVEHYLAMREGEKPYLEYVDGEIIPKAMPNLDHGDLVHVADVRVGVYALEHGGRCGPEIRIEFATATGPAFRIPDLSYWGPGRPRRGPRAALPPTLAIEVVSPDDTLEEQRAKCLFYRGHGVDAAWLIDPHTRTVEVYEPGRDGERLEEHDTLRSSVLVGFELPLSELFAALNDW
jgi:Uma2 family endonuclease